ncbi:MAG: sodium:solute symporter family transporter [Clostridia bacterium]
MIAASAFSKSIYHGILKKDATDKEVLWASRLTLIAISIIAMIIALDGNSIIFKVVSFAWAGFGIYELLPAFVLSCIVIVIVSLLTKEPSQDVLDEFELAKSYEL